MVLSASNRSLKPIKVHLSAARIHQLYTQGFADSIRFRYYLSHPQLDPLHCTQLEFNPFLSPGPGPGRRPTWSRRTHSRERHFNPDPSTDVLRIPLAAVLGTVPSTHELAQPEYVYIYPRNVNEK